MSERSILDLVIALLPGLKPVDRIKLLQIFDREEDFIVQFRSDIENILKHGLNQFWDIDEVCARAGQIDAICRKRSIEWVSWKDEAYPPMLREMYDPPSVIFYRGRLPYPGKPLLGMVGTRKPSPEASAQSFLLACGAGRTGISVVSGLALGIDAMSHRGNLAGGVPGYAVLGSGTDEIYPASNRHLAKQILDSGGALISEYPPGTRPYKGNFPARNRIISALSRSVLIVEAPQKSGALHTASFALEQGRDLWVASTGIQRHDGALYDKRGTVKLAYDGAEIIYSVADILKKWNIDYIESGDYEIPGNKAGKRELLPSELVSSMADYLEIDL
ncbi:MAG: DNA-processing protein DprA [Treponema sp.]|nr:DNA-processing protein DprA [Treponema sp.]